MPQQLARPQFPIVVKPHRIAVSARVVYGYEVIWSKLRKGAIDAKLVVVFA